MRIRQSRLKQFADCPNQYRYAEVLGLGSESVGSLTVLGSVWHYSVEVYERLGGDLGSALATFEYYWAHPEELGFTIDFWHRRTTFDSLLKRGRKMLIRYDELAPWGGDVIGTELRFEVPLGSHVLEGTIDKLVKHQGQRLLTVVDYKTGSHVPEKLKYNLQFTAYCYATERPEFWEQLGLPDDYYRYAGWKRSGEWFHARNTKVFNAGYRGAWDYKRLRYMADEMERSIEENIFILDYSGVTCGYCAFVDICGDEVEDPRLLEENLDGSN